MGDRTDTRNSKTPLEPGFSLMHWMELCRKAKDLAGRKGEPLRSNISTAEVATHNTKYDAWTILDGEVYNMTPYLPYHPGGVKELMKGAGVDCTDIFNDKHCWVNGAEMLKACHIGKHNPEAKFVASVSIPPPPRDDRFIATPAPGENKNAIDIGTWQKFEIIEIQKVSKMTRLLRFALPEGKLLGLSMPGQHLTVRACIGENNAMVERPYTPVSLIHQEGYFDLMVKVYPNGRLSKYIGDLKVGDTLEFTGPRGTFGYLGDSTITFDGHRHKVTKLGMVAGGSGITPMLQVLRAMLADESDHTQLSLVFCNHSVEDIVDRAGLDSLESLHPRFKVHYVVTEGDVSLGTVSRLNEEILKAHLPEPSEETYILHCGTPSFDNFVETSLGRIGHTSNHIYSF